MHAQALALQQQQFLQQAAMLNAGNPAVAQALAFQFAQSQGAAAAMMNMTQPNAGLNPALAAGAAAGTPAAAAVASSSEGAGEERHPSLTGRSSIVLYMSCDDEALSDYQVLVRKNIELFEAVHHDVESNAQGRNRPIVLGQVGIRCRHCNVVPPRRRQKGCMYFPTKLVHT